LFTLSQILKVSHPYVVSQLNWSFTISFSSEPFYVDTLPLKPIIYQEKNSGISLVSKKFQS